MTQIKEMLAEKAEDGKITCHSLRRIAEGLGVSYSDAGKAADSIGIKITNCELGCF